MTNFKSGKIIRQILRQILFLLEKAFDFKTDPTGYIPNRWRMLTGNYERFLIQSIIENVPEKGVFVDVGANVGYISRSVAKRRPLASSIIAIEPNPSLFSILTENLSKFKNCKIYPVGLSSQKDKLKFYFGKDSATGSFIENYNTKHHYHHSNYHVKEVEVSIERGDALLETLPFIDVMKIDVEGFEYEAFKGLSAFLRGQKIACIFFEFNVLSQNLSKTNSEDLIRFLKQFGYSIYGLEGSWKGKRIEESETSLLAAGLGEHGYTTLLAKPGSTFR